MNSGVKVTGYNTLPKMDEATLTNTLGLVGPVTAYVVASSSAFQLYTSGVFTSTCQGSNCTSFMTDHAINLEGYGTDATGNEYYILRNSWGTGWGN
jgi:cathepsin L